MLKRLAQCIREYKKETIITLIFITAEVVIEVFIPFLTADMVNEVKNGAHMSEILKVGILLVVMACASLTCGAVAGRSCAKASAGFAKNMRHDIFSKVQTYSFENIDKFSTSSLVTRMTTDVMNVQMSFMMLIRTAIRSPLMLIFCCVMAYVMGGALSTAFVVVIPVLVCGLLLVAKYAMPAFRRVFKKYDNLNESIEENVRGMRVVKGFVREEFEKEKFDAAAQDICADFTRAERIVALNSPLMQFCMNFNMVFILFVGAKMVVSSGGTTVDLGQISAMITYGMQILMNLMMLSMIYVMVTMSAESAKRIYEVLTEEPSIKEKENPVTEVKDGSIDFHSVSFRYASKGDIYALKDVELHIPSGMTVGILGGTGSSKSSLVQMIARLYDVTDGSVKVGGVDVRDYKLHALREEVAIVLQKNQLFSGTIRDNLCWGKSDATDEEIREACRLAQADDFVMSFPDGYDTMIEQGGTNVSGGQKQRLCIARALLKKPKILILDDSTSAVDTRTDAMIREGFKTYIPETTKIIIAQRVVSVQDADMIVVMDGGKIVATGTHETLLQDCEIYREVYEQQMKGGDEDEA
ncbi:MAG: ABC transporter ATP-binding protein [Oscillospiraceae bacterium]|nr:ABC transporter ATP-binding protein [Oscillospiraceae bacterium]